MVSDALDCIAAVSGTESGTESCNLEFLDYIPAKYRRMALPEKEIPEKLFFSFDRYGRVLSEQFRFPLFVLPSVCRCEKLASDIYGQ